MLGRAFALTGEVLAGNGYGAEFYFPTFEFAGGAGVVCPARAVFLC